MKTILGAMGFWWVAIFSVSALMLSDAEPPSIAAVVLGALAISIVLTCFIAGLAAVGYLALEALTWLCQALLDKGAAWKKAR